MTQTFKLITEAGDTEITFRFIEMECVGDNWVISAVYESEKPVARKTCQDDDFSMGDYCPECGKRHAQS